MNSQTKNSESAATQNKSSDKQNSNNQKKRSSEDPNDFRQQVSELAATGASIAIRKAFDASMQSVSGSNGNGNQLENINWRKLLVWVAISGVTIGVAKFLNSETIDDLVKEYLED